jgi:tetratricopeptide (TPR) repeat protein
MTLRFADAGPQALKNIPERVHAYTLTVEDADTAGIALAPEEDPGKSATRAPASRPRGINWTTAALSIAAIAVAGMYAVKYLPGLETKEPAPQNSGPAVSSEPSGSAKSSPATSEPAPGKTETAAKTPEPDPGIVRKAPAPLASRYVLTRQWRDCQQSDDAETAAAACASLLDSGGLTSDDQAEITYRYGRALRDKGDPDKAIDNLSRSIALNPSAEAYNYRGIAYYDKGEYGEAIADYSEALRMVPSFADAVNNRAWTRFKAGDLNAALDDANRAIQLDAT